MDFSMSISNTVSKGTAAEEMSFFQTYLEDEASRLADGIKHETITGTAPEEKYKTSEENKIEDLPALPDKILIIRQMGCSFFWWIRNRKLPNRG